VQIVSKARPTAWTVAVSLSPPMSGMPLMDFCHSVFRSAHALRGRGQTLGQLRGEAVQDGLHTFLVHAALGSAFQEARHEIVVALDPLGERHFIGRWVDRLGRGGFGRGRLCGRGFRRDASVSREVPPGWSPVGSVAAATGAGSAVFGDPPSVPSAAYAT